MGVWRRAAEGGWFALPSGGLPTRAKKYLSQEKIMVEEKKDGGILCAAKRARGFLRRPGVAFAKAKKTRAARRARKGKAAAMVDDYKKTHLQIKLELSTDSLLNAAADRSGV